ncbi:MAG: beta-galactosidase [Acidobacteria bacterium]|nr:beta-galactosidase [Acidobacteriota bacterium]
MTILRTKNTRIEVVESGVTDGSKALRVEFDTVAWPSLWFSPAAPFNLLQQGEIALDITNPMDEALVFRIRVDDDPRADGSRYCRNGSGTIQPGETRTYAFPLHVVSNAQIGMRGVPTWAGTTSLGSSGSWTLDLSHIVAFQIFMGSPKGVKTLIVDNVRFRAAKPLDGITDALGQYAHDEWPGKLTSAEDLTPRLEEERQQLDAFEPPQNLDTYGGWLDGPRLEATGYFRTEKHDGKWWLVTPEGSLFFSVGPNAISPGNHTFITGRENMFTWLPEPDDPLRAHVQYVTGAVSGPIKEGMAVNFHGINIERKYGPEPFEGWASTWLKRLRAWGFNTIGNWSDSRLFSRSMPYVIAGGVGGTHNRIATNVPTAGSTIHDPFDPRFADNARSSLRAQAVTAAGDPFFIGWFIDNEISWGNRDTDQNRYAIATGALEQEYAASPAKQAFIAMLREKYGEPSRLNEAWGTSFASWESVAAAPALNAAVRADYSAMVKAHARTYFSTVRRELKALDPDHLYLGSRFAGFTLEAAEACAEFCDVMAFNVYQRSIVPSSWRFLEALDRPAIIGEFHFGALDRGMFHTGLVAAASQEERARFYQEYVRSVINHPSFVGCHWFQAFDQPITGRTRDGENYNIGLVDIADTPYPELNQAAREIHSVIYAERSKKE